jgi:hypothetical protein
MLEQKLEPNTLGISPGVTKLISAFVLASVILVFTYGFCDLVFLYRLAIFAPLSLLFTSLLWLINRASLEDFYSKKIKNVSVRFSTTKEEIISIVEQLSSLANNSSSAQSQEVSNRVAELRALINQLDSNLQGVVLSSEASKFFTKRVQRRLANKVIEELLKSKNLILIDTRTNYRHHKKVLKDDLEQCMRWLGYSLNWSRAVKIKELLKYLKSDLNNRSDIYIEALNNISNSHIDKLFGSNIDEAQKAKEYINMLIYKFQNLDN